MNGAKEAKSKPVGPAPLQYPTAGRHESEYGFGGMKLCIKVENLCQRLDKLFLVIFAGYHTHVSKSQETVGTEIESFEPSNILGETDKLSKSVLSWRPLSRTEELDVSETSDTSDGILKYVVKQFNVLQGPVENDESSYLMFVLCRNVQELQEAGETYNFGGGQMLLGKFVVKREVLNTTGGIFKFDMPVVVERVLDLSSSPWGFAKPKITLGVIIMNSKKLSIIRSSMSKTLQSKPYAETAYAFRSTKGQVLIAIL